MTTNHIFYIPLVLLAGFILGLILGRRSALVEAEEQARLQRKKESRAAAAPKDGP